MNFPGERRHATTDRVEYPDGKVIPFVSHARSFLVLTTQRTGSSWLMDRLDHSAEVEGHMELFYFDVRREPPRAGCNSVPRFVESRQHEQLGRRPLSVFRYLDRFYSRRGAVGFKLMYSQLRQYPEILPWLAWRRLPVVHLLRENHLDVVISEAIAERVGSSHATREEARQENVRITLDPERTVQRIRRLTAKQGQMRSLLKLLPNPVHEMTYERLCAEPAGFERLYAFLHMNPELVRTDTRLVKRQRARHEEVIENYAQVHDALSGAGVAGLLHEHGAPLQGA